MNTTVMMIAQIIDEREKATKILNKADSMLRDYHKKNLEICEAMYPEILQAIQTEVFDRGLCYEASYEYLSYASKEMGPHYQLRPLGKIVKYDKKKKESYENCTINNIKQCDNDIFKIRITNRYFSKYYPNYELLKKELNIDIK